MNQDLKTKFVKRLIDSIYFNKEKVCTSRFDVRQFGDNISNFINENFAFVKNSDGKVLDVTATLKTTGNKIILLDEVIDVSDNFISTLKDKFGNKDNFVFEFIELSVENNQIADPSLGYYESFKFIKFEFTLK